MQPPASPDRAAFHAALPHPALRGHVSRYVQAAFDVPPGECVRMPVSALPSPVLTLTWSGDAYVEPQGGRGAFVVPPVCLSGPVTAAAMDTFRGAMRGFFVRFTPTGALAVLGVWGGGMPDGVCDPAEAARPGLGPMLRAWADEVASARGFAARVAATDRLLLACLRGGPPRNGPVSSAALLLEGASGTLRVAEVARFLDVGESTLRRRFLEETGLSAKQYAQIVRFRHTHAFLRGAPNATWADAVVRFGYADQAHLTRAYTRFAGAPPSRWRADEHALDLGMGLEEEGERFLQDS